MQTSGNTGTKLTRDWRQWEGRVVNGRFPLRQYLGGSEKSAVFLTERRGQDPQKAAIKLILADSPKPEIQLSRWEAAAKLSHPHLLCLFETGRCQLDDAALLFVVMEYADENLAQILPQRPLTPAETREMLEPTLDTLAFLHSKSFVHGRLKPVNIMAVRDQLKLSSDSLLPAGDSPRNFRLTAYDAPEIGSGKISTASDAWSLGMTLMEALTQRLPVSDGISEPVPEAVPSPFMGIAHCCLRRDPHHRCSAADIAARLRATSSFASQRPSTLRIPAESAPWRYILPLAAVVLVAAAVLIGPKLFAPHPDTQPGPSVTTQQPAAPSEAGPVPAAGEIKASGAPMKPSPAQTRRAQRLGSEEKKAAVVPPPPAPVVSAVERTVQPPVSASPAPASGSAGEETPQSSMAEDSRIVQRVVPSISQSALGTITGTVRVTVKVEVDSTGSVSDASFVSEGPSQYFARKAMEAAKQWRFAGSTPRTWVLRFGFKRGGTSVAPEPAAP
jgi:TonB family protein